MSIRKLGMETGYIRREVTYAEHVSLLNDDYHPLKFKPLRKSERSNANDVPSPWKDEALLVFTQGG